MTGRWVRRNEKKKGNVEGKNGKSNKKKDPPSLCLIFGIFNTVSLVLSA
jgi:hypothetical protein